MGAATKNFQEIRLELSPSKSLQLPNLIFSSAVTKLEVVVHDNNCLIKIPDSVCWSPRLKTLILDSVELPISNGRFKLNCPVLENLILKQCGTRHLNVFFITASRLKNLVIEDIVSESNKLNISISTPILVSLKWTGRWYSDYYLRKLSSLAIANINFLDEPPNSQVLAEVLEAVSGASTIELSGCFEDCISLSNNIIGQFSNLKRLKIMSTYGDSFCFSLMLNILKKAPCIETLLLDAMEMDLYEEDIFPFEFPCLKIVEIGRLRGNQNEVKFFEFLLKNAVGLQKLVMKLPESSELVKRAFGDKIFSLPSASSSIRFLIL